MIQVGESPKLKIALYLVVLVSCLFVLIPKTPLHGQIISLVFMPLVHIYLPGWLLLRALRIEPGANPITVFAWVAGIGFSFSIVLGGLYRFLALPVEAYTVSIHVLMLVLVAFLPKARIPVDWQEIRQNRLIYFSIGLLCVLALGIGIARSQLRYSGWEDQTVFIGAADWLANDPPDVLEARQVGIPVLEMARWVIDGWTYQHAVWSWSTGIPAATIIWHFVTPLFSWMTPLLAFAVAYELSERRTLAFYASVGFMIAVVLTLDSLVYISNAAAYGQNMVAQLNTLRMFSTAIMLPLCLLIGLSFLKSPQKGKAAVLLFSVVAMAFLHSRQIVMIAVLLGLLAVLIAIRERSRQQIYAGLIIGVFLAAALSVPLLQRESLVQRTQAAGLSMGGLPVESSTTNEDVPGVVATAPFTVNPNGVFYHPIIIIGFVSGIGGLFLAPRRLENQFIFVVCLALLALFFAPVISRLFVLMVTPRVAPGFILMLPLGLIFGTVIDNIVSFMPFQPVIRFRVMAFLLMLMVGVLFFEPIPITASGKDQLRAMYDLQADRRQLAADRALLDRFNAEIGPLPVPTVIMSPNRIDNYVIEQIPYAFVIGGRAHENRLLAERANRFYMEGNQAVPFLDSQDLALLEEYDVRYIIVYADDTRLPMLLMQPERFQHLFDESGYAVFAVLDLAPDEVSERFTAMNAAFIERGSARWLRGDFDLRRPGASRWNAFAEAWQTDLTMQESTIVRYGLAASLLLAGDDSAASGHWRALADEHPQIVQFQQALAHSLRESGDAVAGRDRLLAALAETDSGGQAVIARTLLQELFFYMLEPAQIEQVVAVIQANPVTWELLATYDKPVETRRYAMLLMSAGQAAEALNQLDALSPSRIQPGDVVTRTFIAGYNDPQRLLDHLSPYLDFDNYAVAYRVQADRWQHNSAAGFYHMLRGNLAQDAGQLQQAIEAYEQAIAQGLDVAGEWFLAEIALEQGDFAAATAALDRLAQSETPHAQLWALSGRYQLALAQGDSLAVEGALEQVRQYAHEQRLMIPSGAPPVLRSLTRTLLPQNAYINIVDCCTVDDVAETMAFRVQWLQRAYVEYPENQWGALIFDGATYQRYGEITMPALWVMGAVIEWPFAVPLETSLSAEVIGIRVNASHLSITYADAYAFDRRDP